MSKISIREIEFDGLAAVEVLTSKARLVAVTGMGPRIAWFGRKGGRNLLYWDTERKYFRGKWYLMGGHRVWTTRPLADESEEAYADDNEACALRIRKDGFELEGATHPVFRIRKGISVKVLADDTLVVENRVTNESDMVWSGGVWGLTVTLPKAKTFYGIPLGRQRMEWDVFAMVIPKRWGGAQGSLVNDPAVRLTEDCMVVKPKGRISKRMVQAPQGIIGMTDPSEKIAFVKHCPYVDGATYPLNTNIAYYVGKKNFMVEMETMGPETGVLPGGRISTQETWMLRKPVDWARLKGPYPLA
ncbi:MAG TPA: hypothetical protein VK465_00320 [Fibrobacteria bacterium]|nr:hypothetical protein [Fibrobacteria bacterium]